ncbi:lysophospholipase [Hysterangium stoloniferum]|nr:lysophospholipase [Hysterangium stoloniferum]
MDTVLEVIVYPCLSSVGLYTPADPTYGRYLQELSTHEVNLEADKDIKTTARRVFLHQGQFLEGEYVTFSEEELQRGQGKEWVVYKIWQKGDWNGCDIIALHGINDYGGKWAAQISSLISKGYRVIALDLPSHGRSSGLHCYISSSEQLVDATEAVLVDLDNLSDTKRKIFMIGVSMGGGLALNYCAGHPGRTRITGVYCLSPMIGVAPETMPAPIVQTVGRMLQFVAGRLAFATAVRGNASDDPRVEEEFLADPRGYHGKLRITTGLSLLNCMLYLTPEKGASFRTPFRIVHGNHDRVTSYQHSVKFFEAAGSEDKDLIIYEGWEHVLLKVVGGGGNDDEMRMKVLTDMEDWLDKRA